MVRVAVVSDTHGEFRKLEQAVAQLGHVDWLIHAGDYLRDAARVAAVLGVVQEHVIAVVGNCDFPLRAPEQAEVTIGGVRIWVTHGHHFGVKHTVDRIYYRARELGVRVAIYGHSHVPVLADDGGLLLFNPGSLSDPRLPGDPPSCGLLEISEGRVKASHLFLG